MEKSRVHHRKVSGLPWTSLGFTMAVVRGPTCFGLWGLEFVVGGMGCGVWALGCAVEGLWFGVWSLGFGVWDLGFGVWGLGFWFGFQG